MVHPWQWQDNRVSGPLPRLQEPGRHQRRARAPNYHRKPSLLFCKGDTNGKTRMEPPSGMDRPWSALNPPPRQRPISAQAIYTITSPCRPRQRMPPTPLSSTKLHSSKATSPSSSMAHPAHPTTPCAGTQVAQHTGRSRLEPGNCYNFAYDIDFASQKVGLWASNGSDPLIQV